MAVEKKLKTRIIQKHETEEHWNAAEGFIPLEGEIIIYDIDSSHSSPRLKIGDGKHNPKGLSFYSMNPSWGTF